MDYKYRQIDCAEKIINNGFQDLNHMPTELRLVATYMRRNLNYKPKQLKENFYEWCSKNINGYSKEKYYKAINRAINQAIKKDSCLIQLESIDLYEHELNYINDIIICDENGEVSKFDYECRKVLFTLYMKMKINSFIYNQRSGEESSGIYFKGGTRKYNLLKKESKISQKTRINEDIINLLMQRNIITPMYNGLIILNFIKDMKDLEVNEKVLKIKIEDFENLGYYYDYLNNMNKVKLCSKCGKPIKIKSKNDGSTKYCESCAKKIFNEQCKENMRKMREKRKML